MRQLLYTIIFLFLATTAGNHPIWAQSPTLLWQKNFGGTVKITANQSNEEKAIAICAAPGGGHMIAGVISSTGGDVTGFHGTNYLDGWLIKLDDTGALAWQKCLGGTGQEELQSIAPASDSGYIVAGWTNSNDGNVSGNHGGRDVWVVKVNDTGGIQWQKCLGGTADESAGAAAISGGPVSVSVKQTFDGGYIIAASTASSDGDVSGNHGGQDFWLVKLDAAGSLQWQKTIGGSSDDIPRSVYQLPDSSYMIGGQTASNNTGDITGYHGGASDYWLVKTDQNGTLLWQKTLGGSALDEGYALCPAGNRWVMAGTSKSIDGDVQHPLGGGTSDWWLIMVDSAGNYIRDRGMGNNALNGSDFAYSIRPALDGGFIAGGSVYRFITFVGGDVTATETHSGYNSWVVKLNDTLGTQWKKILPSAGATDIIYDVAADSDGSYTTIGIGPDVRKWRVAKFAPCPSYSYVQASTCQNSPYSFDGNMLSQSGVYYDTLSNSAGCDSIVKLTLTVYPVDTTMLTAQICAHDQYSFYGDALTTSGTYFHSLQTVNGCDSIIRLELTIDTLIPPVITANNNTLHTFTGYATYQWLDSAGNAIGGATDSVFAPSFSGPYQVTVTNANGCSDTSASFLFTLPNMGIPGMSAPQVNIYPNPASDRLYIELPLGATTASVRLTDLNGRDIARQTTTGSSRIELDIRDLPVGLYICQIRYGDTIVSGKVQISR